MTDDTIHTAAKRVGLQGDGPFTISTGGKPVVIEKLYGPLIACDVRIHLDRTNDRTDWVVERERITNVDGDDTTTWEEVARFDCQESIDWDDEAPK